MRHMEAVAHIRIFAKTNVVRQSLAWDNLSFV